MSRSALAQVRCQGCCWRPEHLELPGLCLPSSGMEGLGVAEGLHCCLTSPILAVLTRANPSSFVSRASSFCLEIGICWVQEIVLMQRAFFSSMHPRNSLTLRGKAVLPNEVTIYRDAQHIRDRKLQLKEV